jgi:hypothetical protein
MYVNFWAREGLLEGETPRDIVDRLYVELQNNPVYVADEYAFLRNLFRATAIFVLNRRLARLLANVLEAGGKDDAISEEQTQTIRQAFDSIGFMVARLDEQLFITPTHLLAFAEILKAVVITQTSPRERKNLDAAREQLASFIPYTLWSKESNS